MKNQNCGSIFIYVSEIAFPKNLDPDSEAQNATFSKIFVPFSSILQFKKIVLLIEKTIKIRTKKVFHPDFK
jgi:hypothetical protein